MISLKSVLDLIETNQDVSEADLAIELTGLAPLDQATEHELSFLASAKFRRHLQSTQAKVTLVSEKEQSNCPENTLALVVEDPYLAYATISHLFDDKPLASCSIHETAVVDKNTTVGENVSIAANAVIEAGAIIGDGVRIGVGAVIEGYAIVGNKTEIQSRVTLSHHCKVGKNCLIQSGTVIGSNGFGYAPKTGGWQAIAQIGRVIIGDRVEIGANCTLDRGAIEDTVIQDDVIIDNLVHIAHNVEVGKGSAIAAQVGIAGSTVIGEGCTFGGQAGVTGHINIAHKSHFTGQAMVTKGTSEGGLYSSGIPAQNARDWRKMIARMRQLESIVERLTNIEKNLKEDE